MSEEKKKSSSRYHDERLESGRWFEFPKTFLENMHILSDAAVRIYLLFRYQFNWAENEDRVWPSYEFIMDKTGIKSKTTIRNAIVELAEFGWIKDIHKKFSGNSTYFINSEPEINDFLLREIYKTSKKMSEAKKGKKLGKGINRKKSNSTSNVLMKSNNCTSISTQNELQKSNICTNESPVNVLMKSNNCTPIVHGIYSNDTNIIETNLNETNLNETNSTETKKLTEINSVSQTSCETLNETIEYDDLPEDVKNYIDNANWEDNYYD